MGQIKKSSQIRIHCGASKAGSGDVLQEQDETGWIPIHFASLECIGKLNLLKALFCAFNTSDSTTIPLTLQNWQITSKVPDSTDFVMNSSNKCLAVRTVGMPLSRIPQKRKFCKSNQSDCRNRKFPGFNDFLLDAIRGNSS